MNTIRGRNVATLIREAYAESGRTLCADEIAALVHVDRANLTSVFRRLERQQVIRRETVFRPCADHSSKAQA